MVPDKGAALALILNDCYLVRHYERGARLSVQRLQRQQAMQKLASDLIEALSSTDDPGPVLTALVDGLCPRHDHRF